MSYMPFDQWFNQCRAVLIRDDPNINSMKFYTEGTKDLMIHESAVLFLLEHGGWSAVNRSGSVKFVDARNQYGLRQLNKLELMFRQDKLGKYPVVACNPSSDARVFAPPDMSYVFMSGTVYGMDRPTRERIYEYDNDDQSLDIDFYIVTIRHGHHDLNRSSLSMSQEVLLAVFIVLFWYFVTYYMWVPSYVMER